MSFPLCKACNVEDFSEPALRDAITHVYGTDIAPPGREDRKMWEVGMATRALQTSGALRPDAEILGVGAGHEATVYYLTNMVRRVFATDLYLTPGSWARTAASTMLADPAQYWGQAWHPRRLVVQHMDATELMYDDGSFDGIFSSSSIEHFGTPEAVRRSASEMCRVLKRGGVCTLSTELRLLGEGDGLPGTRLFTGSELHELIVEGLPWELVEPLELTVSPLTRRTVVDFAEALADVAAGRSQWTTYPHVVLSSGTYTWTSVHLVLSRK